MDNPVETSLPDEFKEHANGSLGYVSDGEFVTMYGPPKKMKDVGNVTITKEKGWQCSFDAKGIGYSQSKSMAEDVEEPNLLFSFEHRSEDPDGLIFIQQPWPTDGGDIIVRAVYPGALRGEGAMVRSNLTRVYVIDDTIPHHAVRGYLAVEGLAMVETFLGDFNMESRFESYWTLSFVVEDTRTYVTPKGYYITARPSSEDPTHIICHLKERANGPAKNVLRALFPLKSQNSLGKWVKANFLDAKTLLFD